MFVGQGCKYPSSTGFHGIPSRLCVCVRSDIMAIDGILTGLLDVSCTIHCGSPESTLPKTNIDIHRPIDPDVLAPARKIVFLYQPVVFRVHGIVFQNHMLQLGVSLCISSQRVASAVTGHGRFGSSSIR